MLQWKGDKITFGVTVESDLFDRIEKARTTERGRIPRNEFVKTAIVKLIEDLEDYMEIAE